MSERGGLPAIHPYLIGRRHYLHELTQLRAKGRVHFGHKRRVKTIFKYEYIAIHKAMCKLRKDNHVYLSHSKITIPA